MAHAWLSQIREELGRIHHFELPQAVLDLAEESDLRVDDNFRLLGRSEEVENWLNSLQLKIWPPQRGRPKKLLIYVGLHRMADRARSYKDCHDILLSLLSDETTLRIMQTKTITNQHEVVTSSDASETASEEDEECGLSAVDDFATVFKALATEEAIRLGARHDDLDLDNEQQQQELSLTIIELAESFESLNGAWWRCIVDHEKSSLKSAWLLVDHAIANELNSDDARRRRFEMHLRDYIKSTHRKYKELFSAQALNIIDVLHITDDNDRLWTVGVKTAPAGMTTGSRPNDLTDAHLAPQRSVYELLFNRKLACRDFS